jgi:hypothetical protein
MSLGLIHMHGKITSSRTVSSSAVGAPIFNSYGVFNFLAEFSLDLVTNNGREALSVFKPDDCLGQRRGCIRVRVQFPDPEVAWHLKYTH